MADLKDIQLTGTYYNLIPSRFPTVNLFERLDATRQNEIADIESRTNPRFREKKRILGLQEAADTDNPKFQNFNHAPFIYYNPDGTTFYGPNHPALELAEDQEVAILQSLSRREAFLRHTKQKPMALEMRELSRSVSGNFADLRDLDILTTKEVKLKLGQQVDAEGFDGVIFRSKIRPSATCISVRKNNTLGSVTQCDHFKFFWDGEKIIRVYSFGKSAIVELGELSKREIVQAA